MNNLHIQQAYCIYTIAIITFAQSEHCTNEALKTLTLCRIMVIHEDLPFESNKLIFQRQQLLLLCHYLVEFSNEKVNACSTKNTLQPCHHSRSARHSREGGNQSIILTTYDPNRMSYWKLYWMESKDHNAALRAHYLIKIYILMRILHPTVEEQLSWLNTTQKAFHCHSPLLLMMQENNAYLLLILESINQQLKQRASELSH